MIKSLNFNVKNKFRLPLPTASLLSKKKEAKISFYTPFQIYEREKMKSKINLNERIKRNTSRNIKFRIYPGKEEKNTCFRVREYYSSLRQGTKRVIKTSNKSEIFSPSERKKFTATLPSIQFISSAKKGGSRNKGHVPSKSNTIEYRNQSVQTDSESTTKKFYLRLE